MYDQKQMQALTARVRALVKENHMCEAETAAAKAMADAPHEAQPHNLMGIIMERENDHIQAMKHFRAAWALDPTFVPARINMERYGSFSFTMPRPAYDEADCPQEADVQKCRIETDAHGIGHVVRR